MDGNEHLLHHRDVLARILFFVVLDCQLMIRAGKYIHEDCEEDAGHSQDVEEGQSCLHKVRTHWIYI